MSVSVYEREIEREIERDREREREREREKVLHAPACIVGGESVGEDRVATE